MNMIDGTEQRRAFTVWLRTGRLPTLGDDGVELKFNPWHDPEDGRFTFAGAGRHFGPNGAQSADRRVPGWRQGVSVDKPVRPPVATPTETAPRKAEQSTFRRDKRRANAPRLRPSGPLSKVAEFADGFGEGVYDVGKETVTGLYDVLSTNPVTTVRNAGRGIAKTIDAVVAAQDIPAYVQVRRAKDAVANASAHDLGYATAQIAGNVVLTAAPGAVATKISAVRGLRVARVRETFHPPKIIWRKETISKEGPAKAYNDSATGARPGQAPALKRTMPDGSSKWVKFDGIDGDYLIDRKLKIVNAPHARAQVLRQSEVLSQHKLIGIWEVPSLRQKNEAIKLLNRLNVKNIKVRIVEP